MNVTILSCFRQATGYLERYFEQMEGLHAFLSRQGHTLHLLLGYGDSTDGTGAALFDECANRFDAHLMDVSHGGPIFGSIEHPQRFRQLAYIGNKLLDNVPANADVVGIIESDLIWRAHTMMQLIEDLEHLPPYSAVAPMIMDGPDSFYDVFAFRKDGARFTKHPPYHAALPEAVEQNPVLTAHVFSLVQLESAGSVLFMEADIARKARFTNGEAIVGLCRDIYRHAGSVWLDATQAVQHPQSL